MYVTRRSILATYIAAMLDERKRERANLETMLARVAGRYVGVWTTEKERERSFLVTSREIIRLPAYVRLYIYISFSLFLSVDSFLTHVERR